MILWFLVIEVGVATLAGVLCVTLGLAKRLPSDLSLGSTALVELLLIAQLVIAIVSPLAGNHPAGDLGLFFIYLVSALIMPVLAGFWALVERSRWSTVILGAICLAIAVMLYRMGQIWFIPGS